MLYRKAIIICGTYREGHENFLPGTQQDAKFLKKFLMSDLGGDWTNEEIKIYTNPTEEEILTINEIQCDYSIVVFTGHGFTNDENEELYFDINDIGYHNKYFKTQALKQTLIYDCCRSYFTPEANYTLFESMEKIAFVKDSTSNIRELYDSYIKNAEPGKIYLYSVVEGLAANIHPKRGSDFIFSLLNGALNWGQKKTLSINDKVLKINTAFYCAKEIMKKFSDDQIPEMCGSLKRNFWSPFAVKF